MSDQEREHLNSKDEMADTPNEYVVDLTGPEVTIEPTEPIKPIDLHTRLADLRARLKEVEDGVPLEVTVAQNSSFDPVSFIVEITDGKIELADDAYERAQRSLATSETA